MWKIREHRVNEPPDFDVEIGLGAPESASAGATAPPAGEPATPPPDDVEELRIKDEEYRVPKDEFQAFADRMGWSTDELREAIQIGRDGRNVYRGIAAEKERLAQAWENLNGQVRPAAPAAPGHPGPGLPPAQPGGFRQRPPAEDVTGQMLWLADMMERVAPALERLPTIEEIVNRTAQTSEERERQSEVNAERAQASSAYNEVSANWKREGFELPAQRVLEAELRKFPISDDLDLSWHEIWDRMGWMIGGARLVRQTRRRAVLDSQTPRTVAPTPSAGYRGGAPPAPAGAQPASNPDGSPKSQEQLDQEFAAMSRTLQGVSVADVAPALSRR